MFTDGLRVFTEGLRMFGVVCMCLQVRLPRNVFV